MLKKIFLGIALSLFIASAGFAQTSPPPTTTGPSAKTATKRPPIFRPNKDQILQVQKILKEKKFYDGDATGSYNDATRAGIKTFQKGNDLRETGTLNRATLEKFGVELTDKQKLIPVTASSTTPAATKSKSSSTTGSTSTTSKKPTTIFRANTEQIRSAQKLLKEKSFYTGDQTGKLDEGTRGGLKKYQEANGVKITGTLNAVTLEKMGIPLTDAQKASQTTPE